MRIAIANWSSRKAGGAETYLDCLIRGLSSAGHETALFCELDLPPNRPSITLPRESPVWCVSKIGLDAAISKLTGWQPDVIYGQGLANLKVEAETLQMAPAILFAHNYYGTCISATKTFQYPVVKPCARRFGWQCLIHFYPHRCGGLSPLTMWSDFRRQSHRLTMLRSYRAIITASEHMRSEYLKHGFAPETVKVMSLPIENTGSQAEMACPNGRVYPSGACRLLFVGRMDFLKGGDVLLDALPLVLNSIGRPLQVTFVGDGPKRGRWEKRASVMQSREPRLQIRFSGWLEKPEMQGLFRDSDLLVIPSLWPEPFGLVGPEAGLSGVPAAGFAVGGIPEWLVDGVNGHLASGDPPSPKGLAEAVTKCLRNSTAYRQLSIGAFKMARRFSVTNHIVELMRVFEGVRVSRLQATTDRPSRWEANNSDGD